MSDPDDRVTGRQVILGGLFAILFGIVVACLILLGTALTTGGSPPAPSTTSMVPPTTVPPPTTTTTEPFANLRASLNDYCAAKHLGHARIVMRGSAPIGGCSGS